MTAAQAQLLELNNVIVRLKDKLSRLDIISPVMGTVQGLEIDIGSVIPPGGKLVELIPMNESLVAQIKIDPKDIGHIRPGQPANVKVSAYNSSHWGSLEGIVKQTSSSTFMDEKMAPYYEGIIEISKTYFGDNTDKNKIKPGMVVTANIITGQKSIIVYLLNPIHRSIINVFNRDS